MWPWVIEQPFRVGSYGLMMAIGFGVSWWLLARDLRRRGIDPSIAEPTIFLAVTSGLIGSKLAYLLTEAPSFEWTDLVSGSGLTWHGGLILAAAVLLAYFRLRGLSLATMTDAVAPMLALGYGFGRIGCQLAGDGDYGIDCAQGWWRDAICMSYPRGIVPSPCEAAGIRYEVCPINALDPSWIPVHPTPVYETLAAFALFGLLWALRRRLRLPGTLFATYLGLAGLSRFAVEFLRLSEDRPDRFLGLRDAQLVALAMVALGLAIAARAAITGPRLPGKRQGSPPSVRAGEAP